MGLTRCYKTIVFYIYVWITSCVLCRLEDEKPPYRNQGQNNGIVLNDGWIGVQAP